MRKIVVQGLNWLWLLILCPAMAGTDWHQPSPRAAAPKINAAIPAPARPLAADSFSPTVLSNRIQPEWLLPPQELYRLGPGDTLEIEMVGNPPSRATATVGPDGKIYYGLLPGLPVWQLTLEETRQHLQRGLGQFLRQPPEIAVTLKSASSKSVWLLGRVEKPGIIPLATPVNLIELLALGGGLRAEATGRDRVCDLRRSFVLRQGKLLGVDFEKLFLEGDLSQNIYLRPNDLVCLRPAPRQSVFVMGAVQRSSAVEYAGQMTLVSALASVGGPVPYAHLSQVVVIRGSLSHPSWALVDLKAILKGDRSDITLEPGDLVHVPTVPWKKLGELVEKALHQFVYTVAVNEGYRAVMPGSQPITPSIPVLP